MPTQKTRDAAAEIAQRIKTGRMDPSKIDEADRPPSDRPPAFIESIMSAKPTTVESVVQLTPIDWDVIELALVHYATCTGDGVA